MNFLREMYDTYIYIDMKQRITSKAFAVAAMMPVEHF